MKLFSKTLLSFSLICYLAVSSVAAVHAFPSLADERMSPTAGVEATNTASPMETWMSEMTPDCHQQSDGSQNAFSACKIFCAAMTSVICNERTMGISSAMDSAEIAFLDNESHTREPSMEPQPPK